MGETYHCYHGPLPGLNLAPHGILVHEIARDRQHQPADGHLVVQELRATDLQLAGVRRDPHRVQRANGNAREGEDHSQR